jgi:hypothetical protein
MPRVRVGALAAAKKIAAKKAESGRTNARRGGGREHKATSKVQTALDPKNDM